MFSAKSARAFPLFASVASTNVHPGNCLSRSSSWSSSPAWESSERIVSILRTFSGLLKKSTSSKLRRRALGRAACQRSKNSQLPPSESSAHRARTILRRFLATIRSQHECNAPTNQAFVGQWSEAPRLSCSCRPSCSRTFKPQRRLIVVFRFLEHVRVRQNQHLQPDNNGAAPRMRSPWPRSQYLSVIRPPRL